MKRLSSKDIEKLSKEDFQQYLLTYVQDQLELSIRKAQSSDNYKLPAWDCYQAEQIGVQKAFNKIIKTIK